MRIVIIDDSGARATVLEEGLREAGYDDIHVVPPRGAFVARLERMAPDVVTMPFGGFKQSGFGRDRSLHALHKYADLKSVSFGIARS